MENQKNNLPMYLLKSDLENYPSWGTGQNRKEWNRTEMVGQFFSYSKNLKKGYISRLSCCTSDVKGWKSVREMEWLMCCLL